MLTKSSKVPWLVAAAVSAVTLAVFLPVLSADFVMWDDNRMVQENPDLRGLSLEHVGWIFTHIDVTRRYTPLAALSRNITWQLCGLAPFGYHFSAWLFHGLNAALVFFALRMLLSHGLSRHGKTNASAGRTTAAAAAGALVWSLHPLRVEPVAWVGANFYSQAVFFSLLSLLCYLRARAADAGPRSRLRYYVASVGLFVAALLSHPVVVGFLAVPVVLEVYPLGRVGSKWWQAGEQRRALLRTIPFAAAALVIAVVTIAIRLSAGSLDEKVPSLAGFGVLARVMQAMYIWAYYLWRPFWPIDLSPAYARLVEFDPLSLPFVVSAAAVMALFAVVIFLRRRWPLGLALGVCYLVLLVPVLGVFEHPHYSSDRYSLLVSVLFSVLVAALLAVLRATWLRNAAFGIVAVVIASLGTLTFRQTHVWHDSRALFEHTIHTLGNNAYAAEPHWRLGTFLARQGRTDEAISHFRQAIRIKPDCAEAYAGLGVAYSSRGRLQEAMDAYGQALRLKPDYAEAYTNLGSAYGTLGRWHDAIEAHRQAVKLRPDFAQAYNNLGTAYYGLGRGVEAVAAYEQAARLMPNSAEVRNNLGLALARQGRLDEACAQYAQAIRIKPGFVEPLNNLALLIATNPGIKDRDTNEAIGLASRACELTNYKDAALVDTLAAAYASAGRFAEAIDTAEKAVKLADAAGQPQTRDTIASHLALYKQGKPYTEPDPNKQ